MLRNHVLPESLELHGSDLHHCCLQRIVVASERPPGYSPCTHLVISSEIQTVNTRTKADFVPPRTKVPLCAVVGRHI